MAFQQLNNRGSLFKNRSKEKDSDSDYSGEIMVDGVVYFIDSWINDYANGKYLSLRVKRKDKQPDVVEYDDDIPL